MCERRPYEETDQASIPIAAGWMGHPSIAVFASLALITGGITMNTRNPTSVKFKRMFVNILSIFVILAMAFPITGTVSAAYDSPFAGHWEAIDVDGSDIRLSIGGPSSGPFQITWT